MNKPLCVIALLSTVGLSSPPATVGAQDTAQLNDLRDLVPGVADQMAENRKRLLKYPGGVFLDYEVEVEQDPAKPVIVFPKGFKGQLVLKWPKIRSLVDGEMIGIKTLQADGTWLEKPERTIREANYDFDLKRTVSRDGNMIGQVGGFRTPFSAQFCFPLVFQDYVETPQQYAVGGELRSDQFLPNCLEQYPYKYAGNEEVGGAPCLVPERKGWDKLWIDTQHGYLVARREQTFGPGKGVRRRTENLAPKEIAPGVWFPMEQTCEDFEDGGKSPNCRMTLRTSKVRVGDVQPAELEVVFPKDIRRIEDMTTGIFMQGGGADPDALERAVEREFGLPVPPHRTWKWKHVVLGALALALSATIVFQLRRS